MKIFISGGCRSGKSLFAQGLAKSLAQALQPSKPLYYLATMIPHDDEDRERIKKHIEEREGWGFETIEAGLNIHQEQISGTVLLDSLTALLANEMFGEAGTSGACDRIRSHFDILFEKIDNIVIVSDFIFSDAGNYDALTGQYRRNLGILGCYLAEKCDTVLEVYFGNVIVHKGRLP
jgi:adenosylcobinamide kinase/adenosylcobinamide-phosphate guanylyltransferase